MSFQRSIDNFRQAVQGFARPTLFTIDIVGRGDAGVASQSNYFGFRWNDTNNTRLIRYTCKASAIPSNTFGVIEVPFMGRKIKYAGDRQFTEWQTTMIIDNDWRVFKELYTWQQNMNASRDNISGGGATNTYNMNDYKATGIVTMYNQAGAETLKFRLDGIFPSDIQELSLDWDSTDTTADLQVTWAYDFSEVLTVRNSSINTNKSSAETPSNNNGKDPSNGGTGGWAG